jgi:hypothetical protein
LRIRAVWADAAYFNYAFLGFVHDVLSSFFGTILCGFSFVVPEVQ